jgi:glucan phosphoethanolaminetransferase (alkaline phosphatase superfamily)
VSFLVAAIAAIATAVALHLDLKSSSLFEIGWLCCGFFILYVTAARTTYIARFYGTFAAQLKTNSDRIYTLDPAHSLQVAHVAWIGQRVLLFWFGIVCLVATLVPLFQDLPHFVQFVVPTASFFSVIFGTIVFLNSESDIRSAVKESAESTLQSTESEITDLFSRRGSLDDLDWKRLNALTALHDKLVATGSYRSALLSGLSLLVPLVAPVAAVWPRLWPILKPLLSNLKSW